MADAGEALEIRTTRGHDWTWVVAGSVMSLLFGYTLATGSDADLQTAQGVRGEWIYWPFEHVVGVTGIRIFLGGIALVFGLNALGAAWRLWDGRVALKADSRGLIFHPSYYNRALDWSDVDFVKLGGRRPAKIVIRLKRRFWSVTHPFTGRNVELNIVAIGSSYRSAEAAVCKMRHWLKA